MSVANFIPTVWEARLIENNHKDSILNVIATRATVDGDKLIVNRVSAIANKTYTGVVEWDNLDTPKVELPMDQESYFAFKVNDVDKVQAKGELVDSHTKEASKTMAETIDTYALAKFVPLAVSKNKITGTSGAAISINKTNIYDYIVDLGTKLNEQKAGKERYCTIKSEVLGLLSKDDRFTRTPNILENGVVEGQRINGMQIVVSEELPAGYILANAKNSLAYGIQISEIEALRLENTFADGIRGLYVYGSQCFKPEDVATLKYVIEDTTTTTTA